MRRQREIVLATMSTLALFVLFAIHRLLDGFYLVAQTGVLRIANPNPMGSVYDTLILLFFALFLIVGIVLQSRWSRWISILNSFGFIIFVLLEINPKNGLRQIEDFVEDAPILEQFWTPILSAIPIWLLGLVAIFQVYYFLFNKKFRLVFFGQSIISDNRRNLFRKIHLGIIVIFVIAITGIIFWDVQRLLN